MLLWIGFAVMTAAVVAALARPLGRARDDALDSRAADLAVYKDQLAEIDAERASGLLGDTEAEAARAEVARRMLARAERAPDDVEPNGGVTGAAGERASAGPRPARARMVMAAVPVVAALLYVVYGSPWLPDKPHAERVAASTRNAQIADLVAKVEARLKEHPEDGQGWDVLAPVYRRFEHYPQAADAYRNAIKLLGATPKRLWGLAESLIAANNGLVPAEARAALEKVVESDKDNLDARFWLAAAAEQDGKRDAAVAGYKALLPALPADTPWRKAVEERLAALGSPVADGKRSLVPRLGDATAAPTANDPAKTADHGPDKAAVEAAARMSPEARGEMIQSMVAGLAERLKTDGRDLAGWQKLVRAYMVMGREPEARKALADARGALKGDAAAEAALDTLAASLGLGG